MCRFDLLRLGCATRHQPKHRGRRISWFLLIISANWFQPNVCNSSKIINFNGKTVCSVTICVFASSPVSPVNVIVNTIPDGYLPSNNISSSRTTTAQQQQTLPFRYFSERPNALFFSSPKLSNVVWWLVASFSRAFVSFSINFVIWKLL